MNFYWYRKDHRKYDGQIFLFYVFWYGTGRAMVEGLRTDSLYIPGTTTPPPASLWPHAAPLSLS